MAHTTARHSCSFEWYLISVGLNLALLYEIIIRLPPSSCYKTAATLVSVCKTYGNSTVKHQRLNEDFFHASEGFFLRWSPPPWLLRGQHIGQWVRDLGEPVNLVEQPVAQTQKEP
jgi:hypothetical protein